MRTSRAFKCKWRNDSCRTDSWQSCDMKVTVDIFRPGLLAFHTLNSFTAHTEPW